MATSVLTRIKDILTAGNIPTQLGERVIYTFRLYQRGEEDTANTQTIIVARSSDYDEICWVGGMNEAKVYKVSGETELIISKLYDGAFKVRQTVTFEVFPENGP